MKKKKVIWILSVLILVIILGISSKDVYDNRNKKKEKTENKKFIENISTEQNKNQRIIMVDGKLYYDTGKTSTIEHRCGTMDGEITLNADINQIPYLNHQANFEGSYGYQFGLENTIEVMIDGQWIVFESK